MSEVVASRFRQRNPLISRRPSRLQGVSKKERLTRRFPGVRFRGRNPTETGLFCCLTKLCIIPPSRAVKNKTAQCRPPGRLIGYARVSTSDQGLTSQIDALKKHDCGKDHIFVDKASRARSKRPGLDACLEELQQGDVLLVLRLDRLGRSMPHLVARRMNLHLIFNVVRVNKVMLTLVG